MQDGELAQDEEPSRNQARKELPAETYSGSGGRGFKGALAEGLRKILGRKST